LSTGTTNEFNALCNLSPAMMLRLEILAFQGPSPVSNAFTQEAERLGLTPLGRQRIEREDRRKFADRMEALRQRGEEFRKTLDLLEQASMEALHENEERLRATRQDLQRIRDRAYEITMPDGTVAKVYRDGDKVRTDDGAEVSRDVVKAEDISERSPSWAERKAFGDVATRIEAEQREILEYRDRLVRARKGLSSDDLDEERFNAIQADMTRMPEAVSRRLGENSGLVRSAIDPAAAVSEPSTFRTGLDPTRSFTAATQAAPAALPSDQDFLQLPPSVAMPAPK
jgi:hypothetical protein